MEITPLQNNFAAGEISPRFLARADHPAYAAGAQELTNMTPLAQGPIRKRLGTKHLAELDGTYGRVLGFPIESEHGFVVIVTDDEKLYIEDSTGISIEDNLLSNGFFDEYGTDWTVDTQGKGDVEFERYKCNLIQENGGDPDCWAAIEQQFSFDVSADYHQIHIRTTNTETNWVLRVSVGTTQGASDLGQWTFSGPTFNEVFSKDGNTSAWFRIELNRDDNSNVDMLRELTGIGIFATDIVTNKTFEQLDVGWTKAVSGNADIHFALGQAIFFASKLDGPSTAGIEQQIYFEPTTDLHQLTIRTSELFADVKVNVTIGSTQGGSDIGSWSFTGDVFNIQFSRAGFLNAWLKIEINSDENDQERNYKIIRAVDVVLPYVDFGGIEFTCPAYTETDLKEMQFAINPAGDTLYIYTRRVAPQKVTYDRDTKLWGFQAVTFTGQPAEWTGTNWPGCVFFFQGRKWVGGTPEKPNAIWGSASGDFEDFTEVASPGAADSFVFEMTKYARIRWISGLKDMMIGTDIGEFMLTSTDDDVIYVGNAIIKQQSQHGSRHRQPELVGNNILFISPDGRKLRDTGYRWTENSYIARDLLHVSEHLTEARGKLNEIHWGPNPDNLLFAPQDDGEALIAVYEWNNDTVGWARVETIGNVISASYLEVSGGSYLFALIKRTSAGVDYLSLEEFSPVYYMDNAKHEVLSGGTEITDADHLAGQTVAVLTDNGAVHPNVVISDGGTDPDTNPDDLDIGHAYLQWETNDVVYGLPYTSTLKTLPLDRGVATGSSTSTVKRRNKVYVRLLESALPLIYGERPPERTPSTPMDTPEPVITGDRQVAHLGWDQFASVTIEQDLPLPLTILGIFGEGAMEKV